MLMENYINLQGKSVNHYAYWLLYLVSQWPELELGSWMPCIILLLTFGVYEQHVLSGGCDCFCISLFTTIPYLPTTHNNIFCFKTCLLRSN